MSSDVDRALERMRYEEAHGLGGSHTAHTAGKRAPRQFKVTFKDGTSETVMADSLTEAWEKARRSARRQISVKQQGRKVVDDVHKV